MEGDKYFEEDTVINITNAEDPNFPLVRQSLFNLLNRAEEKHKKYVSKLQQSFRSVILYKLSKRLDECCQKSPRKQSLMKKIQPFEENCQNYEGNKNILNSDNPKIIATKEMIVNDEKCNFSFCPNLNNEDVETIIHSTSQESQLQETESTENASLMLNEETLSSIEDQLRTNLERSYRDKIQQLMKTEACLNDQLEMIMADRNQWKKMSELKEDKIQELMEYSNRHSCEVERILENSEFLEKENRTLKSEIDICRADYREARSKIQDKEDLLQIEKRLKLEVTEQLQRKICEQKCVIEQLEESNLKALQLLKESENKTTDLLEDEESAINIAEREVRAEEENASEFLFYEPCERKEEDEIGIITKEKENLQKQPILYYYKVLPYIHIENSVTNVTSTNLHQSLSEFEDFLKYQITSIEIEKSKDNIVDLMLPQKKICGLSQSQSKTSELLQTLEKSDHLQSQDNIIDIFQSQGNISIAPQSQDNITDLLQPQANIIGSLQFQGNSSDVLQSQYNDFLQHGDKSIDFLQSQEKSINLLQVGGIDDVSENRSSDIMFIHNNTENNDTGIEKTANSESKILDKEVGKKIIIEESIFKVLDQSLALCLDEAFIKNSQVLNKNKGANNSERTATKKMVTDRSSKATKKTSLPKNSIFSNVNASSIELIRNKTNNVQNKDKYKKKNIQRIHSGFTSQGSFKCNELEKSVPSSPNTSRKAKLLTPLSSSVKCGSNVTTNSNVTLNTENGKGQGVDFIKRNVMRVSIFTKTSPKEDTNNTKINLKTKVLTKRAKNSRTKAKAEKSLCCNIDSKINETNNSLELNTNKTQVNVFSPTSDLKKIPSLLFNESLSFILDDSNKNCTVLEKIKTLPLKPKGVSKSDFDSLRDFINSMSAASVKSASVHSELKAILPSENSTTTNKKLVKFASEMETSTEKTVSEDSIQNVAGILNSPTSVSQTTVIQACETFMPTENSEISIEVDLVQETTSHSSEYEIPKEAVMTADIQLYRVSTQESVSEVTIMQPYVNNEIGQSVRLDEGDSSCGEMFCLHVLISYLTVYSFLTYTFYFLYFLLFILFVHTVFTLRK